MAITKFSSYSSTPTAITDYQSQNEHLNALIKHVQGNPMILTEWTNNTTEPAIALGSVISHGGYLYLVDTADYAVTAPVSDGTYYLKVEASGSTLVLSWVSSITGYSWNAVYNGCYHSDGSQILPYQLIVSGSVTVFTKRKIQNLANVPNNLVTADYNGNVYGTSVTVSGGVTCDTLVTNSGIFEESVRIKVTNLDSYTGAQLYTALYDRIGDITRFGAIDGVPVIGTFYLADGTTQCIASKVAAYSAQPNTYYLRYQAIGSTVTNSTLEITSTGSTVIMRYASIALIG